MAPALLLQAQLTAAPRSQFQARGVRNNSSRVQRQSRPHVRVPAATAEADVAEPAVAAVEEQQQEQPRAQKQQRRVGGKGRKPAVRGPARTLKLSDIEVGKTYAGVVLSTTDFGAFVNIGAETDGLLHISQISAGFTKSVADELANGQDVEVRVLSVDVEARKFAVTMLPQGGAAASEAEAEADGAVFDRASGDRPRQARAASTKKREGRAPARAPPVKPGDVVTGKVASTAAFGCFVEVGDGFTGLLHATEIAVPEGKSWEDVATEGAELEVRVVSVSRDKIALTQRSEEEIEAEARLAKQGLQAAAVPEGASALGRMMARAGISPDNFPTRGAERKAAPAPAAPKAAAAAVAPAPAALEEPAAAPKAAAAAAGGISAALVKELREASGAGMMDCKKALAECDGDLEKAKEYLRKKGLASADKKAGRVAAEGAVWSYIHAGSRLGVLVEVNCETDFVARGEKFKELVNDIAMQVAASPEAVVVSVADVPAELLEKEKAIEMEKDDLKSKPEAIREKIVAGRVEKIAKTKALLEQPYIKDSGKTVGEIIKESVATIGENIQIRRFERFNLGETVAKKESADFAQEVEAQTKAMQEAAAKKAAEAPAEPKAEEAPKAEAKPAVAVSAAVVKQLRESSGAGMMDCKKALAECDGDLEAAAEYLRKKGLASADKKAGRVAAEGAVWSYIHAGSRLGVLVEVNCETDFVARGETFKELVNDIAMQIAACPDVRYVSTSDVPAEMLEKEKAIEMEKEDLKSKPEAIREKIVAGRVEKLAKEMALLEQPFIKDTNKTVAQHIKETVASCGENIQVRRFTKYNLGEGVEKKEVDFAAEVAAQTGGKL